MRATVLMVSLESLRPGSASATHFRAIKEGLRATGTRVLSVAHPKWRIPRLIGMLYTLCQILIVGMASKRIYARWHVLDLATLLLGAFSRKCVVLEVNGTTQDILIAHPRLRPISRIIEILASLQFKSATAVIAVSPGLSAWVSQLAPKTATIVAPNGADTAIAKFRRPPTTPPYAVFVGELAAWQGLEVVLEARRSPEWPSALRLVIVGDGAMTVDVEEAARDGIVDYRGRVPHTEALSILAGATVSLSPQATSFPRNAVMGRPLKISESLILGVPCVGSDFPDTREVLAHLPGCSVVQNDDPRVLAVSVSESLGLEMSDRDKIAREALARCSWLPAISAASTALNKDD